jgi:NAD(P)-dependent dehydrogenase (short-subunit alcohol dehydrogenase family)
MTLNKQEKYQRPVKAILTGIKDLFQKPGGEITLDNLKRLEGKKVLITGASSGLGFATAVELAKLGAFVILANRSGYPDKLNKVKKISGSENVGMIKLDLSYLNNLRDMALEIREKYGQLDIIICNAAMVAKEGRAMSNGLDQMFVVNYLAKFILMGHLLNDNCIRFDGPELPRIIFIASESHRNPKSFDWDRFGTFEPYGMRRSVELYGYYKLLLITYANELSRRLNTDGVKASVFSLCPGPVNSNIAREAPAIFKPILRLVFSIFFKSPGKACKPVIYFAASPEVEGRTADYLFMMRPREMDHKAVDPLNGKILWQKTEALASSILEFF